MAMNDYNDKADSAIRGINNARAIVWAKYLAAAVVGFGLHALFF